MQIAVRPQAAACALAMPEQRRVERDGKGQQDVGVALRARAEQHQIEARQRQQAEGGLGFALPLLHPQRQRQRRDAARIEGGRQQRHDKYERLDRDSGGWPQACRAPVPVGERRGRQQHEHQHRGRGLAVMDGGSGPGKGDQERGADAHRCHGSDQAAIELPECREEQRRREEIPGDVARRPAQEREGREAHGEARQIGR